MSTFESFPDKISIVTTQAASQTQPSSYANSLDGGCCSNTCLRYLPV